MKHWDILKTLPIWDARRQKYLVRSVTDEAEFIAGAIVRRFGYGAIQSKKPLQELSKKANDLITKIQKAEITINPETWFPTT